MRDEGNTSKRLKKPWPTKDVMQQIYAMKLWGGHHADFYSGEGSHALEIVAPYLEAVKSFLSAFKETISICDLGCGDFNLGKELLAYSNSYVAVDIVSELILYNQEKFKEENVIFHCLDIATDDLPPSDCALLRQVLQHLSNSEIAQILPKLVNYQYVILTEHLPEGDFVANKDIISGQGTRLKKRSGVNLKASPFYFKVSEEKVLSSVKLAHSEGLIVTTLYKTMH
jgi:2-polyprenyl-3-methyl-5-hydroxy-6-metoxy-1,4-benzoquinol methylase